MTLNQSIVNSAIRLVLVILIQFLWTSFDFLDRQLGLLLVRGAVTRLVEVEMDRVFGQLLPRDALLEQARFQVG